MHLTDRETNFIAAFTGLNDGEPVDASKAIRCAGYAGTRANQAAYKLLQRPRVALRIAEIQEAQAKAWAERMERKRLEDDAAHVRAGADVLNRLRDRLRSRR
jgi:phage terminase small subunit